VDSFYGLQDQFVEACPALPCVGYDLVLHAALPEFLDVVSDAGDGFVPRKRGEVEGDLVRVVDHQLGSH
jgi:hypothetical protein